MIELVGVSKRYPPNQVALSHVNLRVNSGDFLFVAGASGAGKSTLLKLLYASEFPTKGELNVSSWRLEPEIQKTQVQSLRREIGIVFQDYKLLPRRTVIENVALVLEIQGVARHEREKAALRMLEAVGLADRTDAFPAMLSGGEQQRVAVARALIHRPRILLADEPTGNLDPDMTNVIFDLLLEANAQGVTVVVATHNLAMIEELNLRTVVLDKGKVIGDFARPRGVE